MRASPDAFVTETGGNQFNACLPNRAAPGDAPQTGFARSLRAPELACLGVNPKGGTKMTRVRIEGFTISLDGYGAGPDQTVNNLNKQDSHV